ncbi:hypothetical protein AGDE_11154 [Angomonas deanei]|nr:hypothetical protein AGDE_11154 [Angomonas deanei]|eukprot:EPY26664.1 hypothetical protein AGDE_11154 [Angomonas deanei]
MSPKARRNMFSIAIVLMFVVHDFAKTWLGIYIAITVGFKNMLQTVCLFLSMICFAVGFFTTWISYTWKMSKMLQIRYGYAAANHTLKASAMAKSEHTGGI